MFVVEFSVTALPAVFWKDNYYKCKWVTFLNCRFVVEVVVLFGDSFYEFEQNGYKILVQPDNTAFISTGLIQGMSQIH